MESSNVKDTLSYYQQNKDFIKKRSVERRRLLQNSDKYIDTHRPILIEALNSGQQKYITHKTMQKYSIAIDIKTLKYYHKVYIEDSEDKDNDMQGA